MEQDNEKKLNIFSKIISDIYVSIKEKSLNASELFFFSSVFELTNKILIIETFAPFLFLKKSQKNYKKLPLK